MASVVMALACADPEGLIPAAYIGHTLMVAAALRNPRTDPNMRNIVGNTALISAAGRGHAPVVTLLLADERVDPNKPNWHGFTALIKAAANGHIPVVALLLADERLNPNMAAGISKSGIRLTALRLAARWPFGVPCLVSRVSSCLCLHVVSTLSCCCYTLSRCEQSPGRQRSTEREKARLARLFLKLKHIYRGF